MSNESSAASTASIVAFSRAACSSSFSACKFLRCSLFCSIACFCVSYFFSARSNSFAIPNVGVFSSGVAYTLQILAQKGSNPTVVTLLLSLESVFAVIWLGNSACMA